MKQSALIFLFLFIIWTILSPRACAETIRLASGKTYQGEILDHSDRELRLQRENGVMDIPYRMIAAIEQEEEGAYPLFKDLQTRWQKVRVDSTKDQKRYVKGKERKKYVKSRGPQVELYMTSWCPYCRKMESFLKRNNIKYRRYNIEFDRAANRRYKKMGGGGVPLTKVGDYVIRGYDTRAVMRALN